MQTWTIQRGPALMSGAMGQLQRKRALAMKPCGPAASSLDSRMLPPHRSPCTMPACATAHQHHFLLQVLTLTDPICIQIAGSSSQRWSRLQGITEAYAYVLCIVQLEAL